MEKVEVYEIVINDHDESGVDYIALVDTPAIMKNFMAFNEEKPKMVFKTADKDRRLVMGALMIPDLKIYRYSEERGDFYVYFSKDTIRQINYKYHRSGFERNVNLMHDPEMKMSDVYLVSDFITDSQMGITDPKGFDNPEGTWYGVMKIDNDRLWNDYVKTGELKGFSVEGLFDQVLVEETKEDKILKEIKSIIKSEFKA
jgi:hypothetical protein